MQSTCIQLSQLSHCIHLWASPDARSSTHVVRHPVQKSFDVSALDSSGTFKLGMVENIVGKGENAGYQHFLLLSQFFHKSSLTRSLKVGIVW